MTSLDERFSQLATDHAPGQEVRQTCSDLASLAIGSALPGRAVDFSHGDVDAFTPAPGAFDDFVNGVQMGGKRAYTEYRGDASIRLQLAARLASFIGAPVTGDDDMIITPGSQGALFLALAATVGAGDKVAIVQPDYFANRKLVQFLDAQVVPVRLDYLHGDPAAGLDLPALEHAFRTGVKVFVFSNPNNPTGVVYSQAEIARIGELAQRYGVTVIVDQLYARLCYSGTTYTHLRAVARADHPIITLMGPSKTESLSGYRLGVALAPPAIITRMEQLQAIVSLRAAGYCQSVLQGWFAEPEGWMAQRIALHQAIRDRLYRQFSDAGIKTRLPQAGSYLFLTLPPLRVAPVDFVRLLRYQAQVIVTPGSEFSPHAGDSVRLNFSQDHDAAQNAASRLIAMIARYRQ
ncbi:Aspartate/tyrosine/aromatic aminotransferase [Sodalis praecaptivus]|uniref:Aspartate/tyrosine/aromatic aminotransferase n=1 Tax=Sodalis praecaptivus TaxID=1239307 RepID=W0HRZ9_9GAMM|nr:pyridoxal phosphate-dependent aminotransferase [Sodalis praecaptivus]AHF76601.1 Aspartate/tyrosine/aromatic aminotransferase [Sodalis praecaptivus]